MTRAGLDAEFPAVLVIDDAGWPIRLLQSRAAWCAPGSAAWVLLKHAAPVGQGDLWHELATTVADRLVCLVTADDLRDENAAISRGLSWERSVESLCHALRATPALARLTACRHLIVTFAADAALWLDRCGPGNTQARLVYDPAGSEGDYPACSDGSMTGMAASLAACLAASPAGEAPDLVGAIVIGLSAMRRLQDLGHGAVGPVAPDGFPDARIAAALAAPPDDFASAPVPWGTAPGDRRPWAIVEASQTPPGRPGRPESLLGLAQQVVIAGSAALQDLPHARFGALVTADRMEIESLRNVRRLLRRYQADTRARRPFSVGVFGPPGAAASFGVKQIALDVFGADAWLEFNLSQFGGADDLLGAFHQIRDRVVSGVTPVVFWHECESNGDGWLRTLLAPMRDGRFQPGELTHAIGRSVFVFAGGPGDDQHGFGPPAAQNAFRQAPAIDTVAAAVHRRWLASPDAERANKPHLDRPYDQLAEVDKEANRAAARRIPEVLALAGLGLERGMGISPGGAAEIDDHIRHHLERLAEAEHLGWMQHRTRSDWRYGTVRDDAARRHPALVPYAELPEANRLKDRSQVLSYPEKVKEAGYRIDWLAGSGGRAAEPP